MRPEDLETLKAEARYHRDRYELYHARAISGSAMTTSPARLRELERAAKAAEERLAHARRRDQGQPPDQPASPAGS